MGVALRPVVRPVVSAEVRLVVGVGVGCRVEPLVSKTMGFMAGVAVGPPVALGALLLHQSRSRMPVRSAVDISALVPGEKNARPVRAKHSLV